MRLGERLYRLLLRLLPREVRNEHGRELLQGYRDRTSEPRHRGLQGCLRLWGFLVMDLLRGATLSRRRRRRPATGDAGAAAGLFRDVRLAGRSLRRRPAFAVAVILTLGLGVGAAAAVYSVVDGILLRPLPYTAPDRIIVLGTVHGHARGPLPSSSSPPDVADWGRRARLLESVAASRMESRVVRGDGEPREVDAAGVSSSFLRVLGVDPLLGRGFGDGDDRPGAPAVVILSHHFWQERYGADPSILGQQITLDGDPFTVVGVMGADFRPPEAIQPASVDLWYPLQWVRDDISERGNFFVQAIGRTAPGASLSAVRTELQAVGDQLVADYPDAGPRWPAATPLREATLGDVGPRLLLLGGAVGLLLLIACANVANLFLVRASERDREMAVRTALGASRARLVVPLLAETLLVALGAGGLALLVAHGLLSGLIAFGPGGIPRLGEVRVDHGVLEAGLALTAVVSLLVALLPAREAFRLDPARGLQEASTGTGSGRRPRRMRALLTILETAVALVLLASAALLGGSFQRLAAVDPGFRAAGVAWLEVRLRGEAYAHPEARAAFYREAERRIEAIPGVTAVGATDELPLGPRANLTFLTVRGQETAPGERPPTARIHNVLPGTFQVLRIPILRGQTFSAQESDGPPEVIVSDVFARQFWPDGKAVGQQVALGQPSDSPTWATVVGVVGDTRQSSLATAPASDVYVPLLAYPRPAVHLLARSDGEPTRLADRMKDAVHSLDPGLPLEVSGSFPTFVAASIRGPRFYAGLLAGFATLSLLLTVVGIYGTTAYAVERRTREVAVRIALGAQRWKVVGLVVRQTLLLTGVGLGLGLAGFLAASGVLRAFVFGVAPTDPLTLAGATAALAVLGVVAAWVPSRRAARLDPARALRAE